MNKTIIAVVLLLTACGGPIDHPQELQGGNKSYYCIDGFVYVVFGHGAVPIFDKDDRLPKRCK